MDDASYTRRKTTKGSKEMPRAGAARAPASRLGKASLRDQVRATQGYAAQIALLRPAVSSAANPTNRSAVIRKDFDSLDRNRDGLISRDEANTALSDPALVVGAAAEGLSGAGRPLPHLDRIQQALGGHDLTGVRAAVGGRAAAAADAIGANAYAMGEQIAFRTAPDLHTAAHEAAHVIQQRRGVQLRGGVGQVGDAYERQADAVADAVVAGRSAEPILGGAAGRRSAADAGGVQSKAVQLYNNRVEYEFEGETITADTYNLGSAGRRPYDVIQDHVAQVSTALGNMREGELGAINQFLTHMSFQSATDARPDVLGAIFKQVGKQLWEGAVSRLPSIAGIPGSEIIGVITAVTDELERAAAAQSEYELATFIATLRSSTLTVYQNAIATLQASARRDLEREFSEREGTWRGTIVTGDKATFLRELDQRGAAILQAVPQPIEYEQALITKWITDPRAGGGGIRINFLHAVANGRVRLRYDTEESDGRFTYKFESAELFTSTHSGQAADMFNRVMQQQNKKVYELGVPVRVELKTEGMTPGSRSYFAYEIRSRNDYDGPKYGWPPADRAWDNMPWDPIDKVGRVTAG